MTRRSIATLSGVAVAVVAFAAFVPPGHGSWGPVTGNAPAPTVEVDPCLLDLECNPWLDPPFSDSLTVPPTMPPCEQEDGSGQALPCRWDAASSGNGVGESFTLYASTNVACKVYIYDATQRAEVVCDE